MNPYNRNNEPRVRVAVKANTQPSPFAVIFVVLSLLVVLLALGQASAT